MHERFAFDRRAEDVDQKSQGLAGFAPDAKDEPAKLQSNEGLIATTRVITGGLAPVLRCFGHGRQLSGKKQKGARRHIASKIGSAQLLPAANRSHARFRIEAKPLGSFFMVARMQVSRNKELRRWCPGDRHAPQNPRLSSISRRVTGSMSTGVRRRGIRPRRCRILLVRRQKKASAA